MAIRQRSVGKMPSVSFLPYCMRKFSLCKLLKSLEPMTGWKRNSPPREPGDQTESPRTRSQMTLSSPGWRAGEDYFYLNIRVGLFLLSRAPPHAHICTTTPAPPVVGLRQGRSLFSRDFC